MSDPQFIIDAPLRERSKKATDFSGLLKKPKAVVNVAPAGYDCIRQNALQDNRLTLKATGLLFLLTSVTDPTVEVLASLKREGRTSVMAGLEELERFGYLSRERVRADGGGFGGVTYNILV